MSFKLPKQGLTFWPVGNGDSVTISVTSDIVLQVDVRHLACAENDDDPKTPIIDELVARLPKVNGEPYLAVFALTHPDKDHICGFEELSEKVNIGEIWLTPRVFEDIEDEELSEDAEIFMAEAERRVTKTVESGGKAGSGDRIKIIGYSELLAEEPFKDLPKEFLFPAGSVITTLDGYDCQTVFKAFVHAPFKSDAEGERNDTSLGLQITLSNQQVSGKILLFGDHCYPVLKRVFEVSEPEDLAWNVFLAPHHCSKSAMHWKDGEEEEEVLKQDILDALENHRESPNFIVASSSEFPEQNESGDLPPHIIAREQYEQITDDGFICTGEVAPDPISFELQSDGFQLISPASTSQSQKGFAEAIDRARGTGAPPKNTVGFGSK